MAGIYLHIPFCKRRCIYCNFYSTTGSNLTEDYVSALILELKLRRMEITEKINTIYLGGGTPSQLTAQQINKLITEIYSCFEVDQQAEITIEANPDDISEEWLDGIANSGVNRISLGIQTFNEKELTFLKRRHTGKQAINAVKTCQKHGFKNMSIDLIYGLPHQDLQNWQNNIDIALDLNIQHLSAYALIYEKNTLLWRMKQKREVSEANDEYSLEMFETLIKKLTASGFEHYEISNFALPGFYSRHNSSYWQDIPYLGCGASAHSYDGNNRKYNKPNLSLYLEGINTWHQYGTPNVSFFETEHLSKCEKYNDRIITSLRTCWGLNLKKLEKDFGKDFLNYCLQMATPHFKNKTLQIIPNQTDHSQSILKLTQNGIFLSDGIMSDLLYIDEQI